MAEYWGAKADPNYGYSPYSGQLHYGQHEGSSEPFTAKAGENNTMTIEEIKARIHNMHPEKISALADQWQNAWTLLENVRSYVLQESNLLHDEHWHSPKARDAFLMKGPGDALAYLDVWMDATQKNVTALRHLTHIAQDARRDIDTLFAEYQQKLKDAQNVDLTGQLSEWFDTSRYWMTSWDDAKKYQVKQQVDEVTKTYQLKAQDLAYKIGNQHYDYTSMVSTGVGPPYRPMNAVLNTPGAPPMPNLPSFPGGSSLKPPPPPGTVAPPPPPPPGLTDPTALQLKPQGDGPVVPPGTPPAQPVVPPGTAPAPPPAPGPLPVQPALVAPLPAPPPAFNNKGGPGGLPSKVPGSLPPGSNQPAPSLPPNAAKPPNPGQLTKSAFGKGTGTGQPPGSGQPPGKTLRRPNGSGGAESQRGGKDLRGPGAGEPNRSNPNQPGRPGERRKGERSDGTDRVPGTPIDAEEAFGRPSGGTAPPVLKNPTGDRSRRRPGSQEELRPTAHLGGDAGDGLRRDGTAPPVLNRPTRTGEVPPPTRGRPDRKTSERDRKAPAGAGWIGADEARADAGSSILDAPAPPPTGSRVSKLEEIPKELRSRAATRSTDPARAARPGTVSPELSKRRTSDEPTASQQQADDEAPGIVTDEQAFEVQTPGGGVVTSQREEAAYEPEIRRVLGGR